MADFSHYFDFSDLIDPISRLHRLQPPPRLALLGTPVAHSRSPEIHNLRLRQRQLPWHYVAIDVQPDELPEAFDLLRQSDFIGFNLTMPHKQQALRLVDEMTDHARLLGAINTVTIRNRQLYGSNSDGPGFVAALQEEWRFFLKGASVLILGATGGTGRAVAMQSALEKCHRLVLVSRTPSTLEELKASLKKQRPLLEVETIGYDEDALTRLLPTIDLIVNTTPATPPSQQTQSSIPISLFEKLLQPHHLLYDIVYSKEPTALMKAAREAGAHAADGLSMLRLQAALSFETWLERIEKRDSFNFSQ
jgi:shikimate dehydrogenase